MNVFVIINEKNNVNGGSCQNQFNSNWQEELRNYINDVFNNIYNVGKSFTMKMFSSKGFCFDLSNPNQIKDFKVSSEGIINL